MTDAAKLDYLLRVIVSAGGPLRRPDMSDEVYLLAVTNWLVRPPVVKYATSTKPADAIGGCGCQVNTP